MQYNIVLWCSAGIFTLILAFYFIWYNTYELDVPKKYNNFMTMIIRHKHILEKINYTKIEEDFEKRELPSFDSNLFAGAVNNDSVLSNDDKEQLIYRYSKLMACVEVKKHNYVRQGIIITNKVRNYMKLPKKIHLALVVLMVFSIAVFTGVKPLADEQKLNSYKEKGIASLEERYISKEETKTVVARIVDRYYLTRFFGGQSYNFKIELTEPYNTTMNFEVDPLLYQGKKITDAFKITDVRILE